MKEIAIDEAEFEGIIEGNFIYVDKTRYIYNIINSKKYYFLSSPRRFGKSLTISTLKAIFEAKKDLFKGLYIETSDWKWEKHPIIHLDFSLINKASTEDTKRVAGEYLDKHAQLYGLTLNSLSAEDKLPELVEKMHKSLNKKVVILIDEYDKPIVSNIDLDNTRLEIAKSNKEFLKLFYDNLKPLEQYLKTVFITGVSKFSKVSIFSTLNNLIELDTNSDYAAMLGYTQEELEYYFKEHFDFFALKNKKSLEEVYLEFKQTYNGFRFTDEEIRVYNPFSVGRALFNKKLDHYWFDSGTPTFLINLIKNNDYDFTKIKNISITTDDIKAYDIENIKITALLYQTGYLTIKEYKYFGESTELTLDFPNKEVEKGFYRQLLESYQKPDFSTSIITNIRKSLLLNDFSKVIDSIKSIYAGISYLSQPKKTVTNYESYYHNIFYVIVTLVSDWMLKIDTEVLTSTGRIDCVLEVLDTVYIIEFKCNHSADNAIIQIKTNNYTDKYKGKYNIINLIGINFSSEKRNIDDWKIETILGGKK